MVSLKMTMRKNLEEVFISCMQEYRSATVGNLQTKRLVLPKYDCSGCGIRNIVSVSAIIAEVGFITKQYCFDNNNL